MHHETGKLFVFFGPDGSGKTTLAEGLAANLRSRGLKPRVSWMRGSHTLASILARALSNFDSFKGTQNPYYGVTIPSKMRRLWQFIEFFSVLPIILTRYVLPVKLGRWVVAERYVPDFVTWVRTTTDDSDYLRKPEARFLLSMSSRANAKIYVTASRETLLRRRPETNPSFLDEQLEVYAEIASTLGASKIDTTDKTPKDSVREMIIELEHSLGND